jgi:hypothetical protein
MTRDKNLKISAATANTTLVIPAGWMLEAVVIENLTANAVTGGVRVGTTDGGAEVVVAQAVAANALVRIADAALLKGVFSTSADQTLYIQAVTSWNSASLNIYAVIRRLNP